MIYHCKWGFAGDWAGNGWEKNGAAKGHGDAKQWQRRKGKNTGGEAGGCRKTIKTRGIGKTNEGTAKKSREWKSANYR